MKPVFTLLISVVTELIIVAKLAAIQFPSILAFYSNWENILWVGFLLANTILLISVFRKTA